MSPHCEQHRNAQQLKQMVYPILLLRHRYRQQQNGFYNPSEILRPWIVLSDYQIRKRGGKVVSKNGSMVSNLKGAGRHGSEIVHTINPHRLSTYVGVFLTHNGKWFFTSGNIRGFFLNTNDFKRVWTHRSALPAAFERGGYGRTYQGTLKFSLLFELLQ